MYPSYSIKDIVHEELEYGIENAIECLIAEFAISRIQAIRYIKPCLKIKRFPAMN